MMAPRPLVYYPRIPIYQQRFPTPFQGMPKKIYTSAYPMFDYAARVPIYMFPSDSQKVRPFVKLGPALGSKEQDSSDFEANDDKSPFSIDEEDDKKKDNPISQDDSLLNNEYVPRDPRAEGQAAYRRRNVYKSIIRHMFGYIRKHRAAVTSLLKEKGFSPLQIEHAYYKMNLYNDMECQSGNPKKSQMILKKIAKRKCVYSYFLKLTLEYMKEKIDNPDIMKVSPSNKEIYIEVCTKFLNAVNKVIG